MVGGSVMVRTGLAALLCVMLSSLASVAQASTNFPGAVLDYLQKTGSVEVDCAVPCTLCHTSPAGEKTTVRDDGFTYNLRNLASVKAGDVSTIVAALALLERSLDCPLAPGAVCDSDGDDMPDVMELRNSRDPDGGRNFNDCLKYGCGASSVAPRGPERTDLAPLWLVAALGGVALLRRVRYRSDREA
jgi:hypothetical protein